MGYFTETMALFEFKSDIEKANSRRLMHDLNSNQHGHQYAKMHSKDGHEFGWKDGTADGKWMHDRTNKRIAAEDQQYYENRKRDRERAKSDPEYAKRKAERNIEYNNAMKKNKSCNESFSEAFDSIIL